MRGAARIDAICDRVDALMAATTELTADAVRTQREYLAASAWRYLVTLDRLAEAADRPLRGRAVIDIGAYPGHIAALLRQQEQADVTAITLSTSPGFERQMQAMGIAVAVCDVERQPLPAPDDAVDVALCCEVIEHLDGDIRHVLREARRVLRDEGIFLLTTPNHASLVHRWALARGRSVYPRMDLADYPFYAGAGVRNPMRHVREFTVGEIASLLGDAGFTRLSIETASPPARTSAGLNWRGRLIGRVLRMSETAIPNGGELIVAVARP